MFGDALVTSLCHDAGLAGDAKFSNRYLVSIAQDGATDGLGKALLEDEELKKW
jgi:hypothetical protein